jgi:hypothetical protein
MERSGRARRRYKVREEPNRAEPLDVEAEGEQGSRTQLILAS